MYSGCSSLLEAYIFVKTLRKYVSCEFNVSADRSIFNFASCGNSSRVSHFFLAIGYYWAVTPLDGTAVDETIRLVPCRTLKEQIDTQRSGYTRQSKVGLQQVKRHWLTNTLRMVILGIWRRDGHFMGCLNSSLQVPSKAVPPTTKRRPNLCFFVIIVPIEKEKNLILWQDQTSLNPFSTAVPFWGQTT